MTANYNTIHIPNTRSKEWKAGDVFDIDPNSIFYDHRIKVFIGMRIESVAFNFGQMLYFDWDEWQKSKKTYFEKQKSKPKSSGRQMPNGLSRF